MGIDPYEHSGRHAKFHLIPQTPAQALFGALDGAADGRFAHAKLPGKLRHGLFIYIVAKDGSSLLFRQLVFAAANFYSIAYKISLDCIFLFRAIPVISFSCFLMKNTQKNSLPRAGTVFGCKR